MRAGAELVWSDCMLRKIWLEDMVRVSFDALEKVVVSSIEQFGPFTTTASSISSISYMYCNVTLTTLLIYSKHNMINCIVLCCSLRYVETFVKGKSNNDQKVQTSVKASVSSVELVFCFCSLAG